MTTPSPEGSHFRANVQKLTRQEWEDVARKPESETDRLDDAARAGWLYYIAGNTQDEIARKLGVSRQTAQRLVSLAVSEKLIKVRLDHPIAHCLELSEQAEGLLRRRFLRGRAERSRIGIELARRCGSRRRRTRALSRRRSIRSSSPWAPGACCGPWSSNCRRWIARSTRSCRWSAISRPTARPRSSMWSCRIADTVKAPHYPMPLPVIASDRA